jgi:hypothetical protein
MRALAALLLVVVPLLAGCTGPGGNPNLRPPCADSSPVRIEVVTDKERYLPAEVINATLVLNNGGDRAQTLTWRSWEVTMRSFDARIIRGWVHEVDPSAEQGATLSVAAHARVTLQDRWQPFRVSGLLVDPLQTGTYYLCAVLVGTDGSTLATGARAFVALPPPQRL